MNIRGLRKCNHCLYSFKNEKYGLWFHGILYCDSGITGNYVLKLSMLKCIINLPDLENYHKIVSLQLSYFETSELLNYPYILENQYSTNVR